MLGWGVTMYGLIPPEILHRSFSGIDGTRKRSEILAGAVPWLNSTA